VRLSAATGRTDAWLVAAIRDVVDAETDTSTGTRSRLIRRVVKAVEASYGPGVVPLPGRSTFYRLIDALATGRHVRFGGDASADCEPAAGRVHADARGPAG
jgi:putative transposase